MKSRDQINVISQPDSVHQLPGRTGGICRVALPSSTSADAGIGAVNRSIEATHSNSRQVSSVLQVNYCCEGGRADAPEGRATVGRLVHFQRRLDGRRARRRGLAGTAAGAVLQPVLTGPRSRAGPGHEALSLWAGFTGQVI